MKKLFVCLMAMFAISVTSVYAVDEKWNKSAMLEQGDSIRLFYGAAALTNAYNAAADSGAVITLSKGAWGDLTISKKIKLIGHYGFNSSKFNATVFNKIVIGVNDVVIDGVYCGEMQVSGVDGLKVIHSLMSNLYGADQPHVNTTIDQCVVTRFNRQFFDMSANLRFYNSTLPYMSIYNTSTKNENIIYVTNCAVRADNGNNLDVLPYGAYHNNVIGCNTETSASYPNVYYYNTFVWRGSSASTSPTMHIGEHVVYENNITGILDQILPKDAWFTSQPLYPVNPGLGSDGTPRGPLGGSGFTDAPNVPRVTQRDIDIYPDSIGNINVKISVSAE